jgi:hypothetical protein
MKNLKIILIVSKSERNGIAPITEFEDSNIHSVHLLDHENESDTVIRLVKSNLILTVGNWSEDPFCDKMVKIARLLEKEIIHESKFKKYAEQRND